jgi:hypothetical protein
MKQNHLAGMPSKEISRRTREISFIIHLMDLTNPVIQLCMEGTRAEFEGRRDDARALYQQAWDLAQDDYEACIAAHYVARFQDSPEQTLRWNQLALEHAQAANAELVKEFYPSLYLNMGRSHEALGEHARAKHYYALAVEAGIPANLISDS